MNGSLWWIFNSMLTKRMSFGTNIMNGVYKWWSLNSNDSLFNFFIGPSTHFTLDDALISSLLDPLEGLGMLNWRKLELGAAPDF